MFVSHSAHGGPYIGPGPGSLYRAPPLRHVQTCVTWAPLYRSMPPPPQKCSNLTVQGSWPFPPLDTFKLFTLKHRLSEGIQLKCLLGSIKIIVSQNTYLHKLFALTCITLLLDFFLDLVFISALYRQL